MLRFAVAVFLSSFLLFQVQPIIARYILPWFGGGPAIWTVCMLFFQAMLLGGYAYAHLISAKLAPRRQVKLHLSLLALSLLMLPITPTDSWRPTGNEDPTLAILLLLLASVGLPYMLVSSTAPLLQRWFSYTQPHRSPYRLYALSNAGSLLGLLSYPFVFEPIFGLQSQTLGWSVGYVTFVLACGSAGKLLLDARALTLDGNPGGVAGAGNTASNESLAAERTSDRKITVSDRMLWMLLPAVASVMLLAVTNHVSQNVAVIPFLWVAPLALYLVSFIITFDNDRWYDRRVWIPLLVLALAALTYHQYDEFVDEIYWVLPLYCAGLFVICMVCHGEVVRLRPAVTELTTFYLLVSTGGALGGLTVSIVAPAIFDGFWEFHFGLIATLLLTAWVLLRSIGHSKRQARLRLAILTVTTGSLLTMALCLRNAYIDFHDETIASARNFYGALRVSQTEDRYQREVRRLYHGTIRHGLQFTSEQRQMRRVSYFSAESGVGAAIDFHPKSLRAAANNEPRRLHIGVIGLGAGALAASTQKQDRIRFYEIDPNVVAFAENYFTFLARSPGAVEIVLGDARVSMERELEAGEQHKFDVLAVDAFSGDAIPVHLLTLEAVELYFRHLKTDGILAVHISNRHIELSPVVRGIADALGKRIRYIKNSKSRRKGISRSTWALISNNDEFMDHEAIVKRESDWPEDFDGFDVVWTDDYSTLIGLLE